MSLPVELLVLYDLDGILCTRGAGSERFVYGLMGWTPGRLLLITYDYDRHCAYTIILPRECLTPDVDVRLEPIDMDNGYEGTWSQADARFWVCRSITRATGERNIRVRRNAGVCIGDDPRLREWHEVITTILNPVDTTTFHLITSSLDARVYSDSDSDSDTSDSDDDAIPER